LQAQLMIGSDIAMSSRATHAVGVCGTGRRVDSFKIAGCW